MSDSPYLVVDASLALKWALDDEQAVAQAVQLRDDAIAKGQRMLAPSLWLYEVSNGLVTAVKRSRLTSEQGREALAALQAVGVTLVDPLPEDVYSLAAARGIPASEAGYLALARELQAPFWTGDHRLYRSLADCEIALHWVGDYGRGSVRPLLISLWQ